MEPRPADGGETESDELLFDEFTEPPENSAEFQSRVSLAQLRRENETLRRELKGARRIQAVALLLLVLGVIFAYFAGHYYGRKNGVSDGYDAGFRNAQQQAAMQTAETEASTSRQTSHAAETTAVRASEGAFVGNSRSKTYHRADCSFLPNEANRVYFKTAAEAEQNGYQPCGHCAPSD